MTDPATRLTSATKILSDAYFADAATAKRMSEAINEIDAVAAALRPPTDVELARWAFLNPETGDWIEVEGGVVHGPLTCPARDVAHKAAQIGFTYGALGRDFEYAYKNVEDMLTGKEETT